MTAGFVAGVLEGFEGTLDAAREQIEESETTARSRSSANPQRQKFEKQEASELRTSVP